MSQEEDQDGFPVSTARNKIRREVILHGVIRSACKSPLQTIVACVKAIKLGSIIGDVSDNGDPPELRDHPLVSSAAEVACFALLSDRQLIQQEY